MKTKIFFKLSSVILIFLIFVSYAAAQAGRGKARISGVVKDEEGNPIQSAKIVVEFLKDVGVKRETVTNNKGEWAFIGVGTGTWRATASAEGYISSFTEFYVRQLDRNPKVSLTLKKIKPSEKPIIEDEASLNIIERASELFEEEKYDEAIVLLEKFLEQNPLAYLVHLSIGDCYNEKGEPDKAIEEYNMVLENAKEDDLSGKEATARAFAGIGECYLKKEELEKAQDYFKQSIEAFPDNEILAYNVGEIYFSNQRIEDAIHYFELSIQIKPDWGPPYLKLGYVYLNKGDYEKAKSNFNKFLEIDPESPNVPAVKNMIDYLERIKK